MEAGGVNSFLLRRLISHRQQYSDDMIEVEKLCFKYGGHCVFEDAVLYIREGGVCGLLGENGAGKTTLMKILLGLLRGGGRYSVMGYVPWTLNPSFLEKVYYVPEDGTVLRVTPEVYAERLGHFYPNFSSEHLDEYLDELGVPADRPFDSMSFGQRKKASISVALSMNTPLSLMDEPTNGLDIPSKVALRSILSHHFTPENGRMLLVSTHQVRDVEEIVNSVAVISRGHIRYDGLDGVRPDYGRVDLEKLFAESVSDGRC